MNRAAARFASASANAPAEAAGDCESSVMTGKWLT